MKRKAVAAIIALAALGGAGAYWYSRSLKAVVAASVEVAPLPIAVSVAQAYLGPAVERLTLIGTLRSKQEVAITPPEAGHVIALPFGEGSLVKQGDLLIALDSTVARADLAGAEQQLRNDQLELDRVSELGGKGFSTRAQIEKARVAVASSQAVLIGQQAKVNHRSLSAPFAGQIGRINYSVGAYLSPGDIVTTLRGFDVMEVAFKVPESRLAETRLGMMFSATVAGGGMTTAGKVAFISPDIDPTTRSAELLGQIPNPDGKLKTGMFARISLELAVWEDAVLVPETALVYALSGEHVYRIRDGKAERAPVVLGLVENGVAQIRSGVAAGDQVIIDGRFQVRHGSPVLVAPKTASLAAGAGGGG